MSPIFSLEGNETIKWQPLKSQSSSMTVTIVRDEPTNLSQDSLPTYHMNDHIVERFDDGDTDGDVGRSRFQRVRPFFLSVSYGFFIFIAVLVLTLILLICLLPTIILALLTICIYYSVARDPIPPSILLRSFMASEQDEDARYPNLYPQMHQRPLIEKKIIIRKLTKITELDCKDVQQDTDSIKNRQRRHPFPIKVYTEHLCLEFSEPIVIKDEESEEEDKKVASPSNIEIPLGTEDPPRTIVPVSSIEVPSESEDPPPTESPLEADVDHSNSGPQIEQETSLDIITEDQKEEVTDKESNDHDEGKKELKEGVYEAEGDYFGINEPRDRGTVCDICLIKYRVGDEIAWSPNMECTHSFHKDCLLDWLVRKTSCPNCRRDYLKK